ncbi:MAG: DedA family protein [Pseudonocardiaceae bacterium]|nr:DedA family protein [Pseudonocardiaceae bacterium]
MVFPGEAGVLVLGTTATSPVRFGLLFLVVGLAASIGDHVGYWLGRRYGVRLRETRLVRRLGVRHWDRAMLALHRHGAAAVLLTRMVPVVRTLSPAGAGASRLPYRRFLPASIAAGLLWSGVYVGLGAFAGASARYLERMLGTAGWIVLGVAALACALVWWSRRRRAVRVPAELPAEPVAAHDR